MTKQRLLDLLAREFALEGARREIGRELRDIRGVLRDAAMKSAARRDPDGMAEEVVERKTTRKTRRQANSAREDGK